MDLSMLREIAKTTPGVRGLYWTLRRVFASHEAIFTAAYRHNRVNGMESVSGPGSELHRTTIVARELPRIFREFRVSTILDIPCGDCNWMSHVELKSLIYIGADIVHELVEQNGRKFEGK